MYTLVKITESTWLFLLESQVDCLAGTSVSLKKCKTSTNKISESKELYWNAIVFYINNFKCKN